MHDIIIEKPNEVFVHVVCERGIAKELSDIFEFYVPGYKFMPLFKNKVWDGKIRLFNLNNYLIYAGLVPNIIKFCEERGYTYKLNYDSKPLSLDADKLKKFIDGLGIPLQVRDYQFDSFKHVIENKKALILSPTGSGKSLIIYLIVRFLQLTKKKGILIVPTINLVYQMYKDFKDYGYDTEKNCHMIYSGEDKNTDKFLSISTWQSIHKLPPEYFHQFDFVIGDEAHTFQAGSLKNILENCENAEYRVGTTGTLNGTKTHQLVLEGLFGPIYKAVTTKELMDKKQLSELKIKCIILEHPEETKKNLKGITYEEEINFLVKNKQRNNFIKNLAFSLEGNTLILFNFVKKHGDVLYELIKEQAGERKVFYIHGEIDADYRENVREIVENEKDAIILASYGTFSAGVNIRNLHNLVLASPTKSRIRNLQSIGRTLRLSENKTEAVLYDISDDLRYKKYVNHTLKHFLERVKNYDEQKFKYKFYNITI